MTYSVKEIYYTLQGEGAQTGSAAVFCRFSGCNLWSGVEEDRHLAKCSFCDTDFVGTDGIDGGKFHSSLELAGKIESIWEKKTKNRKARLVVFTGGEPGLQLDRELIDDLHRLGFRCAVETNGTVSLPPTLDWVCVSPKVLNRLAIDEGDELKLVYPQEHLPPENFINLNFDNFYLQPMDNDQYESNLKAVLDYCLSHPEWKISVQTHKFIGID